MPDASSAITTTSAECQPANRSGSFVVRPSANRLGASVNSVAFGWLENGTWAPCSTLWTSRHPTFSTWRATLAVVMTETSGSMVRNQRTRTARLRLLLTP